MRLIDFTYFDRNILVAGMNTSGTQSEITADIDQYQEECLEKLLGRSLYDAFMEGLLGVGGGFSSAFSSGFQIGSVATRWKYLRDGITYTYGGRKYRWRGLVDASNKQSIIAFYVFRKYMEDTATHTTTIGETTAKSENAEVVDNRTKTARAWRLMVQWAEELYRYLDYNRTLGSGNLYPEYVSIERSWEIRGSANVFGI